jgi:glucokinase
MQKLFIPIAFPQRQRLFKEHYVLAADIGGTKTHLALCLVKNGKCIIEKDYKYASKEWDSFEDVVLDFSETTKLPDRMCVAFPGPVVDGKAQAANLHWKLDCKVMSKKLKIPNVSLINDLEANAYGISALNNEDVATIYNGKDKPVGNVAVISPGTGLGEAGLFWDGAHLHPFATEGGHCDFGPRSIMDTEILQYLQSKHDHVSWERVLSGPGIHTIYRFLRDVKKRETPFWLEKNISDGDPAAEISKGALDSCAICDETLEQFVRFLAIESANLALKLKSTGGLFIGGGIIPKIWNEGFKQVFLEHFFPVGRLQPLIQEIPIHIILNSKTALLGAAFYGVGFD